MHSSRAVAITVMSVFVFGTAFAACGTDTPAASDTSKTAVPDTSTNAPPARTPVYAYDIVQEWPHDRSAFTQGLQWHENRLFEGTGQVGQSSIREVELQTGRVIRKRDVPPPHFGEGIVILGDNLYEITWTTGVAFVYDWRTFNPKGQFRYEGQGWGLTTDGKSLIMSDGSSTLQYRDPATFAVQKTVSVSDKGQPVSKLNELEWVKGEVWANVWESDQIARINPATGEVTGWIDLKGILPPMDRTGGEDVLNGIAYDAAQDRLFVTGKLWPKLYEIKLKQRS
jgi:glutaminyl-peptide cyclotransferase